MPGRHAVGQVRARAARGFGIVLAARGRSHGPALCCGAVPWGQLVLGGVGGWPRAQLAAAVRSLRGALGRCWCGVRGSRNGQLISPETWRKNGRRATAAAAQQQRSGSVLGSSSHSCIHPVNARARGLLAPAAALSPRARRNGKPVSVSRTARSLGPGPKHGQGSNTTSKSAGGLLQNMINVVMLS